ncbi:MAG: PAS domain-containing protein [Alphaproteobacteria bacterium]|nr:MAG: PAS domain-containing protein [Alphaproteobacteria bacterium]
MSMKMRHGRSQQLYEYWDSLRAGDIPPYRHEIEPHRIKTVLPNAFILQFHDTDHIVFRLAGTHLCELYGREFRDQNFLQLWSDNGRRSVRALLNAVLTRGQPALIEYTAETFDHTRIPAEILLLPLRDSNGRTSRILGSVTHQASHQFLAARKIVTQEVIALHLLNKKAEPQKAEVAEHILHGTHPSYLKLVHSKA